MQIELLEELSSNLSEFVQSEFKNHSLKELGADGGKKSYVFIAKEENEVTGLISGRVFYGVLQIKHLIVKETARGQGLGSQLLDKALEFGIKGACRVATVETLSFQALDFYKKNGFKEDFVRSGYDLDLSFHYLSKELK